MRCGFVFLSLLLATALAMPGQAGAQAVAAHSATAPAAAPAKPASTIIPGSPLAALTGAAPPAENAENPPSPFGTEALGLSVTHLITVEATGTVVDFVNAIQKSTRLTPVWQWLQSFGGDPVRRADAGRIAAGLAITLLPALAAEALIRLGLSRPRAGLVARGRARLPAAPESPGIAAEAGEVEGRPGRRETLLAWAHRLLLAVLLLLLNLLPILGFGVAAGLLLGAGFVTARDAHLSVVGVGNAYLVCRSVLEISRFFTAPWTPQLRLFAMADAHAQKLNKWLRIMLATGGFSYAIVSIAEILELPAEGAKAVIRILVLALHVELALMVWLSRRVVAGWIRGRQDPKNVFAPWRRRLAASWHYPALFYILALWVAWAGGVHNAFGVLLRVVLYFMAAIFLGRLGWSGSDRGLERLFPDPKARDLRHPNFIGRARNYNPLVRTVIRIIIAIGVLAIILLGWGVNLLPWLLKNPISHGLLVAFAWVMVIVAIALVIWEFANNWLDQRTARLAEAGKTRQALRLRTLAPILKATFGTVIGLIAGLLCLSRIGVNAAPLLAGAGVLGIAIGFGSQKLVQDIITGLFLLLEDTMQVGDVVTLAGMSGTVERLTIRTISLRGGDGSVNIIPFSAVTTVTNQTRDFGYAQIAVGVGYEENIDHVCAVLTDIARSMRAEASWGSMMRDDLQINGLDQFGASALMITGQIRTGPGQHWAVRREFNRRMVLRFAAEHIEIPYTYLPPAPPPPLENASGAARRIPEAGRKTRTMTMDAPWLAAIIPLLSMLLAAGFGMRIRLVLKEHHKNVETTDLLRVTVTMLVTFAAIVLGLLITSSKANFDTADDAMQTYAAVLSDLDDALQSAGPPAAPIRRQLAQYTAAAIASTWTTQQPPPGNYYPRNVANGEDGMTYESQALGDLLRTINGEILQLPAQTASQTQAKTSCAAAMTEVQQQRWTTIEASEISLSTPIFIVLVFWLFIVFLCLGLNTPVNAVSLITIGLGAVALASALFVVVDLNGLYAGLFIISSDPMRGALAQMLSNS